MKGVGTQADVAGKGAPDLIPACKEFLDPLLNHVTLWSCVLGEKSGGLVILGFAGFVFINKGLELHPILWQAWRGLERTLGKESGESCGGGVGLRGLESVAGRHATFRKPVVETGDVVERF